ncbi:MAG: hypothetical protein LBG27_10565, partial [Spirochaetaceae bacterium]|nr:hypothetical protein [Spirochaetaceae bacterium]
DTGGRGGFLSGKKEWKGLAVVIECRASRTAGDETGVRVRYFISNKDTPSEGFGEDIRGRWGTGNGPRWMFDVNFKEDGCRAKKDGPPKNLNILREASLKPLRAVGGGKRASAKRKTLRAGLVPDFLRKVLFGEQVLLPCR